MAADAPAVMTSTKRALIYVYLGYAFRYIYLLVLIPFYARVLGASEYGRLLAALSLFQIVWLLVEYGFPIIGARDTATANNRDTISAIYGRHMVGRLALALPGVLVGIGGTLWSPLLREAPWFGLLATLNGLVAAFNLGWHFQGVLRFRTSVMLEMLGFAINLPLIIYFVHGPQDAWLILVCLLGSSVVCTVVAHAVALRSLNGRSIKFSGGLSLVRESTALFAHRGLTMLMSSSSPLLMSLFANAQQVGWYGAAERLINVGLSLMQPANQVLVGTVSSRIANKSDEQSAYGLMRSGLFIMTGLGLFFAFSTWVLANPLVSIALGAAFKPTVPLLLVLSLMFPFVAYTQVACSYVLIPLRMDGWVSGASFFGAATTMLLILVLGTQFGAIGVAWARTIGQAVLALLLGYVLLKKGLLKKILSRGTN